MKDTNVMEWKSIEKDRHSNFGAVRKRRPHKTLA